MPKSFSFSSRYGWISFQSASVISTNSPPLSCSSTSFLCGISHINRPAGGQGKDIGSRIGRFIFPDRSVIVIEADAVQDNEPAAVQRIAGHEGFGQVVQGGAVDDDPRLADGIDQGPSGSIAHDIGRAALGAVHECLADIAEDHQFALFHDLAELILGVAVHINLHTVDARRQIIAGGAVDIDPHILCRRTEPAAGKPLAAVFVDDKPFPSEFVGGYDHHRIAIVAFRFKMLRIDDQGFFALLRRAQLFAGGKINPAELRIRTFPIIIGVAAKISSRLIFRTCCTELLFILPVLYRRSFNRVRASIAVCLKSSFFRA